jgi:hypothetical protein
VKRFLQENAAVVFLFLVLTAALASEGNFAVAPKFMAFLLIVYGSGQLLLWSEDLMTERKGWVALVLGLALAAYFNFGALWLYAGVMVAVQVLLFLIFKVSSVFRNHRDQSRDDE